MDIETGTIYSGWRVTSTAIYGGFDFFAIAFLHSAEGASIGDLVQSEHGTFYLRLHRCPNNTPFYNRWLYPIEPA